MPADDYVRQVAGQWQHRLPGDRWSNNFASEALARAAMARMAERGSPDAMLTAVERRMWDAIQDLRDRVRALEQAP